MTLWLVIPLSLLVIAIILVLSSFIDFRIRFYKQGRNDLIELDVTSLFGLVKLHYELPQLIFKGLTEGVWGKYKETGTATKGVDTVKEEEFDKERLTRWKNNAQMALKSTHGLKVWIKNFLSHVKVTRLDWSTDFSLGDAADTAIAVGAMWGVKWTIIGYISHWVKLTQNPRVFVKPVFEDEPSYSMEFVGKGRLSVAYVSYALLQLFGRVLRESGGIRKWSKLLKQLRSTRDKERLE